MGTWTSFYVNTNDTEQITEQLKKLAGINNADKGSFPEDLYDNYLFDESAKPSYLAIAKIQPGWIAVSHNSFNKLSDWGKLLSKNLDTKVIVTIAQTVSDVYYFSLFDKGQKLREIEVCYSDDFTPINFGQKFDFEGEQPGSKEDYDGETEYYFGFEEIEEYCKHFGLTIESNYNDFEWIILRSGTKQKNINDFLKAELQRSKKPWWKFW